jgi:hypothetical protein
MQHVPESPHTTVITIAKLAVCGDAVPGMAILATITY